MRNELSKPSLEDKSFDEKLHILEEMDRFESFNETELEILLSFSQDDNEEVRAKVAELLVLSNSPVAEIILIRLLADKAELVRVNACDSLSNSSTPDIIKILKEIVLKDKSSLVRGYAALSIGDIAVNINYDIKELEAFFKRVLGKERVNWVKINVYRTLYLLGDKSYLNILINEVNNKYYRSRCVAINILGELTTSENLPFIRTALIERLKIEKTVAVRDKIEKFLYCIEEMKMHNKI
jgi:HEAT repeat protein